MDIFVTQKAFNKELVGKAVVLRGTDKYGKEFDGTYLVNEVENDYIMMINYLGTIFEFCIEDFEHGNDPLKIFFLTVTY